MRRRSLRRASKSVAADLGSVSADQLLARATLAAKINKLIEDRKLSQADAAEILGMPQPKVSAIRNYKLHGISLERLMKALAALGQKVEIVVRSPSRREGRF
jgi:predicted XRE-type DNA-binding protein